MPILKLFYRYLCGRVSDHAHGHGRDDVHDDVRGNGYVHCHDVRVHHGFGHDDERGYL
jgi:hypothetical protein